MLVYHLIITDYHYKQEVIVINKKFFLIVVVLTILISSSSFGHDKDVPIIRSSRIVVTDTVTEVDTIILTDIEEL
jgi:hypothetical protein